MVVFKVYHARVFTRNNCRCFVVLLSLSHYVHKTVLAFILSYLLIAVIVDEDASSSVQNTFICDGELFEMVPEEMDERDMCAKY